jgi:hypothetical protein
MFFKILAILTKKYYNAKESALKEFDAFEIMY